MIKKAFFKGPFLILAVLLILFGAFTLDSKEATKKKEVEQTPGEIQKGGVLKIIYKQGPATPIGWPPETVGDSLIPGTPAFETLLRKYYEGRYEPLLSEGWKIGPDKRSITFYLRKGVKFHDGSDFDAEVVKFNLEQLKASKFYTSELWSSIDIVDSHTVRINLSAYSNAILTNLTSQRAAMASLSAYRKRGLDFMRWNPIGTGPFEFVSFERDVSVKYKRFSAYWQKERPYVEGVEYVFIKDPMTQLASMEAKEAHVLLTDEKKVAFDLKAKGFSVSSYPAGVVVIMPDSANASSPFSDRRVREAIEYAIDREAIVKAKGYGFSEASYQVVPSVSNVFIKGLGRKYNPEKARVLLSSAGYKKGIKTKLIYGTMWVDRDEVVMIQNFLKQVGIEVDLELATPGQSVEYRRKGWNGLYCAAVVYFPIHPIQGIEAYIGPRTMEFPSLKRPKDMQAVFDDALSTREFEPRRGQQIVKLIFDDVMVVPLFTSPTFAIATKNVHDAGFHTHSSQRVNWTPERAWLAK